MVGFILGCIVLYWLCEAVLGWLCMLLMPSAPRTST
jgi:hypothetical protein